ncbi:MAG: ribosome assembly factor SBDS [Candidatus Pacearchaeota archaeon]
MTEVIARAKVNGKTFEILVDIDKALEFKKTGKGNIEEIIAIDTVYSDIKKGFRASEKDLSEAFKTTDIKEISEEIIKRGEVQITQEYREKKASEKEKQIIDFLTKNAVDPRTNRPYTPERIEKSLEEAGVNITNKPIEAQINEIVEKLKKVIPLKIETKKVLITIPAQYTGQVYGIIQGYKEKEEWMPNGDLKCIVNIPIGFQIEFYDKLNSITHGSILSEEIKEK